MMDAASTLYLGGTVALFAIFAMIVIRTFNRQRKDEIESPKYRMLDDD